MDISIRRFSGSDGERISVLVDASGMPLYYPTLYATWNLRQRGLAANSIFNALNAIKVLFAWEADVGISLESLFSQGELLGEERVRDLSDFLQLALSPANRDKKVVPISRRPKTVGTSSHYFRLTVVADYVGFLAKRLYPASRGDRDIKLMVAAIRANRPGKPNKSESDRDERYLDEAVVEAVEQALKPGSDRNPAKGHAVQVRNALMFMILRLTGLRRGELLNLKVNDIDFAKNTLRVVRRPDSKGDVRAQQPVAKTRQRTIPLVAELIARIHEYVLRYRNKLPGAKKHGYLFVTHKEGPTQGRPLSIPAFQKWMLSVATIIEDSGVHAHALRHHWNYAFSLHSDSTEMSTATEEKVRSYLMGWEETSGTARIYNRRHTKQKAAEAVLSLQNKHLKKTSDEVMDE
ncbi:tyrosine-type recombinase/integrase [Metapseudomonas resinovorans]|uniref:tyrosine-type recombinase/integrase n=1 Tax=Metapseudomonas resinovorans TaxID=53412 RepID=UPI000413D4D2|nr:site-specific integrase [Pseudomonas resinovorans]